MVQGRVQLGPVWAAMLFPSFTSEPGRTRKTPTPSEGNSIHWNTHHASIVPIAQPLRGLGRRVEPNRHLRSGSPVKPPRMGKLQTY